jgi:integral membrane sensor domain MASE1
VNVNVTVEFATVIPFAFIAKYVVLDIVLFAIVTFPEILSGFTTKVLVLVFAVAPDDR